MPGLKSLPVWMMVHPQERLEGKVNGDPPEAWSVFGEWALNKKRKFISRVRRWKLENEEILPRRLFGNIFADVEDADKITFFEIFSHNGRELAVNPRMSFLKPNFSSEMGDGPLALYQFEKMGPAISVFGVITSGQWDKPLPALGDAVRKLGLSNKHRERLLMAMRGVNSKSSKLKPLNARFWGTYVRSISKHTPNYFEKR